MKNLQNDLMTQDANGNTALHHAASYGLFAECAGILRTAKQYNQLDALKRMTNTTSYGATTGETFLGSIRRSAALTPTQKEGLLRASGESLGDSITYSNVTTSSQLNSHFDPHWNTPIMQLLRDLRDNHNDELLRQKILVLLDTPDVNLLESNFCGDTALHYAIWYGEYDIAEKIIDKTPEKDRALLFAARNSVGLTHLTGGEVPHMNLTLSGQREMARFSFEKTPENSAKLTKWLKLCKKIGAFIDKAQYAEMTHLMQVYGKELQGYNASSFLKAAPILRFDALITLCDALSQHEQYTSTVDSLKALLKTVKEDFSETSVDTAIAEINLKIKTENNSLSSKDFFASPVVQLYQRANETLTRLKDYVNGKSATLVSMVAAATPVDTAPQNIAVVAAKVDTSAQSAPAATADTATFVDVKKDLDVLMEKLGGLDGKGGYIAWESNGGNDELDPRYKGAVALYKQLDDFKNEGISATAISRLRQYIETHKKEFSDDLGRELTDYFNQAKLIVEQACAPSVTTQGSLFSRRPTSNVEKATTADNAMEEPPSP